VLRRLRDQRTLERPGCDDDAPRVEGTVRQGHHEAGAVTVLVEAHDLGVLAHRGPGADRVSLDNAKDLTAVGEAVEIGAGVGVARELQRPVRELKAQGVPSFRAPPFPDASPFQHHVLAPTLLEHGAHRQAGLASPDDDRVMVLSYPRLRAALRIVTRVRRSFGLQRGGALQLRR
jgi:hypothetical protein